MPVHAIVFDIGGVLEVNPRTGWPERWARRLGLELGTFEARLDEIWRPGTIGAATLAQIERRTAEALALGDAALSELMDDAWAQYVGTLNSELADYFTHLRPRYRNGILSNSFVGAREREHTLYGFGDMCDAVIYSHEVGCLKPDPRIYHAVCDALAVRTEEAVLLDDLPENVQGARAVGMQAVTFVDTAQAIADLEICVNGAGPT